RGAATRSWLEEGVRARSEVGSSMSSAELAPEQAAQTSEKSTRARIVPPWLDSTFDLDEQSVRLRRWRLGGQGALGERALVAHRDAGDPRQGVGDATDQAQLERGGVARVGPQQVGPREQLEPEHDPAARPAAGEGGVARTDAAVAPRIAAD